MFGLRDLRQKIRQNAPKFARLGLFLAACYAGLLFFAGRRAKADMHEILLGFGAQMMRYGGADSQDAPRPLYLNGQRMMLATASTTDSLEVVLDEFENRCTTRDGSSAQAIQQAARRAAPHARSIDPRLLDSTIRFRTGNRGYVACLDTGENELSSKALLERVIDFRETGDLSRIGHIRYAYVSREGGRSHIVTFWTDSTFLVREMVPAHGDAPGRDPADIPRPQGARRLLSAWEESRSQSLNVYAGANLGGEELKAWYRRSLSDLGWSVTEPDSSKARGARSHASASQVLHIERGNRAAFLVFDEDQDGKGAATILTTR